MTGIRAIRRLLSGTRYKKEESTEAISVFEKEGNYADAILDFFSVSPQNVKKLKSSSGVSILSYGKRVLACFSYCICYIYYFFFITTTVSMMMTTHYDLFLVVPLFGINRYRNIYLYSRTSVARTLMARLPWLFRTRSGVLGNIP